MSDRLELTWPNKDKFLLVPKDADGKPVWVEPDHPAAREVRLTNFGDAYGDMNEVDPYADNLMFCGDSLDVLRIMADIHRAQSQRLALSHDRLEDVVLERTQALVEARDAAQAANVAKSAFLANMSH